MDNFGHLFSKTDLLKKPNYSTRTFGYNRLPSPTFMNVATEPNPSTGTASFIGSKPLQLSATTSERPHLGERRTSKGEAGARGSGVERGGVCGEDREGGAGRIGREGSLRLRFGIWRCGEERSGNERETRGVRKRERRQFREGEEIMFMWCERRERSPPSVVWPTDRCDR